MCDRSQFPPYEPTQPMPTPEHSLNEARRAAKAAYLSVGDALFAYRNPRTSADLERSVLCRSLLTDAYALMRALEDAA